MRIGSILSSFTACRFAISSIFSIAVAMSACGTVPSK
jgi:hypothetical protein